MSGDITWDIEDAYGKQRMTDANERARALLNRLDSEQFRFTAEGFKQRVKDRQLALDIIAAALDVEREKALEEAAEALCVGCRDGIPFSDGLLKDCHQYFSKKPGGATTFSHCDADEIRALRRPASGGSE